MWLHVCNAELFTEGKEFMLMLKLSEGYSEISQAVTISPVHFGEGGAVYPVPILLSHQTQSEFLHCVIASSLPTG